MSKASGHVGAPGARSGGMKRVGVLGGCFNPVHTGHLLVAESVREAWDLDQVLFLPSHTPPHKRDGFLAAAEDRLCMLRLAIEDNPRFELATDEIDRGGLSYAIDTMRGRVGRPDGQTYFYIIGMDALRELHLWREIAELLQLVEFLTVERPGYDRPISAEEIPLPWPWPERLLSGIVRGRRYDISSSEIRRRIAEQRSIRYLVPSAVEHYIASHGLYST